MTGPIGILAYGSLLSDPGKEIVACQTGIVEDVETPFPIEFARSSGSRGGAPTLIPVENGGAKVRGRIILVSASIEGATDMLYRREIHQVGSGKTYKEPKPDQTDRVRVKVLPHFYGAEAIYTDLRSNITTVTAEVLARLAIESVTRAETGKDGITYLIAAKAHGIRTALSDAYEKEVLRITEAASLDDALQRLRS
ncbi:hypothetical protein [Sphingopyxis indica]|uniref:Gamma-glutamyl cyclotransferase, AIG2-like n=1 Tax=Sphingopyxis indica TaxID=436663 RepID=A0A239H8A8_9SPHN|nr:hypothetical protein [Sphingopyxis indica]SNS77401.1 hypothetical protein SAMN06295955_10520 [Sphingopyxis indica]